MTEYSINIMLFIHDLISKPIEHDSPGFTEELWSSLNHTITLKDCTLLLLRLQFFCFLFAPTVRPPSLNTCNTRHSRTLSPPLSLPLQYKLTTTPRTGVVYSYVADLDSDPLSCGSLWSFNYFFYNATLARIVYFTVVAQTGSRVMARGGMASPGAMSHEAHFGGSQHHGSSASAHAHAAPSPGVSSPLQKRRRTLDGAVSTGAASASGADDDMVDRDRSSAGEEVDLGAYRSTNTGAMWEKNEIRIRADAS